MLFHYLLPDIASRREIVQRLLDAASLLLLNLFEWLLLPIAHIDLLTHYLASVNLFIVIVAKIALWDLYGLVCLVGEVAEPHVSGLLLARIRPANGFILDLEAR